ncbi:MAG: exodeoxyribonuclease VII small subunit [Planctomycetia bacterium TMED53]|nr:MAG: exodeoxyribonuclease VII small subunit [Planctomycetia bacterium TMED53]
MAAKKKQPSYLEATEEIDSILDRIEDSREVDVDALADDVERAAELLKICGERLKRAEMRVKEVTDRLAEDEMVEDEEDS